MDNKSKIIPNATPEILKVGTFFPPNYNLIDQRMKRKGISFGTIEEAAKQYGIKMTIKDKMFIYSSPKNRLQLFVEKLHFARVPFFPL